MKNSDNIFELSIESAVMLLRGEWQTTSRYSQEIQCCLDFLAGDNNNHSNHDELGVALHDYVGAELLRAGVSPIILNQASLKRNITMKNGDVKHPTIAFREFSKAPKTVPIVRSYFHLDPLQGEAISDGAKMRPGYARIPRSRRKKITGKIIDDDIG